MGGNESDTAKLVVIGIAVGLILGGLIGYMISTLSHRTSGDIVKDPNALTADEVKATAEVFINQNLVPPGVTANIMNVSEKAGVYELEVTITDGVISQTINSSISKDGTLFFPEVIDMTRHLEILPPATQPPPSDVEIDMKALIDDDPWAGNREAKVIVVEFSDFQCPFCATVLPVVNQIKSTYGDEILFVYRDMPISSIHPQAPKAAEASQCAFEQDSFWPYHDKLFEKQSDWGGVGVAKFKEYAADLGLDTESFNKCLDSGKYESEVLSDLQDGIDAGATGTPAFFINGKLIPGVRPFSVFQQIIDEELAKSG
jgi:protein-disulfide isomerase